MACQHTEMGFQQPKANDPVDQQAAIIHAAADGFKSTVLAKEVAAQVAMWVCLKMLG